MILGLILDPLLVMFGAWCIKDAIKDFKEEHYFGFGLNCMFILNAVLLMIHIHF